MTLRADLADKDALIATLLARIASLMAQVAALTARVAELEAKLWMPPKTPDNSSVPPSKGQRPSESSTPNAKAKAHAGAHRPLHPNPTSKARTAERDGKPTLFKEGRGGMGMCQTGAVLEARRTSLPDGANIDSPVALNRGKDRIGERAGDGADSGDDEDAGARA